jgi:ribose 5-phosphate isomerase B
MVANRYEKIRAALCLNEKMSELSRQHNDANVIVLGSRLISGDKAIKCINSFINTQFEAGRHINRIEKINNKL